LHTASKFEADLPLEKINKRDLKKVLFPHIQFYWSNFTGFITVIRAFISSKTGLFRSQRCARKGPLLIYEKGRVLYEGLVGRFDFEKQKRLRGKYSFDDILN